MGKEGVVSRTCNYMICTTQRSGKSWLCDILRRVGGFGNPEEHVLAILRNNIPMATVDGMVRWIGDVMKSDPVAFALQWDALVALEGLLGKGRNDIIRRLVTTNEFKVVFLERKDRMQQAISKYLLMQSGYGHSYQSKDLKETRDDVEFDAERIFKCHDAVTTDYLSWEALFDVVGVSPVRVTYEDMCADMRSVVVRIAEAVGRRTDDLGKEIGCVSEWKKIGDGKDVEFRNKIRHLLKQGSAK